MIYFERLGITQKWRKMFEECSGLKINFFSLKAVLATKKTPCISYCSKYTKRCSLNILEIYHNLQTQKYHLFECENGFKIALVPLRSNGQIVSLLYACQYKNLNEPKSTLKHYAQVLSETMNYLYKFECPLPAFSHLGQADHPKRILKDITQYLNQYFYQTNLSLKKISHDHKISYYHLSHLFKKQLGISFVKYLTRIRIAKSIKFLKNRKLTISQVAYAVGYDDPGYFCKVFKEHTNASPGSFRKKFYTSQNRLKKNSLEENKKNSHINHKAHMLAGA
ncbi:MAG: helix-turn-helix transcriptional regulator [Candidatus Omnitrophica bacterium]|nr:helix-turn-helix transcriptional regulator [Candidatus Omnitrophota bacterium]